MNNRLNKNDLSILIGNVLDHFDSALYGFLAPVLAPIFFPSYDFIIQLILTYGILATSIFTRPLGTIVFGIVAGKYGPVTGLSYSLIGVSISTVAMGCVPSYNSIGYVAPIALTFIRMVRGFFSAGEIAIAKLYIIENKPQASAFKASYLYQSSTIFGIILASLISLVIIESGYIYLWRICFWLGGFIALIGYFLRKNIKINTTLKSGNNGFIVLKYSSIILHIFKNKIKIFKVAIVIGFSYVTYSIPFIFMNSFIPLVTEITLINMMKISTSLLIFDATLIIVCGILIRKFSPRKIMLFSSFTLSISIMPLWSLLENAGIAYVTFVRCWIVVFGVLFMIPINIWCKNLFNLSDQYLLAGIGNALGTGILGHMAPSICFSLWYLTSNVLSIGIFISAISLVTFTVMYFSKEQSG